MNHLIEKTFNGTARVRIVTIDDQPWFVAKDILLALNIYLGRTSGQPNVTMAVQKLDPGEAQLSRIELSKGQPRKTMIVSESGLYKLVMRSDSPSAKPFQEWVTRDVLPAIRKDGGYIMGEENVATGEMSEDELVLRAIEVMTRKVERLRAENAKLSAELNVVTVDEYRALA